MIRIGELAKRVGVTTQAVRYYERIGLLREALRTPSGYRLYHEESVDFLRFVKKAQRLGFRLEEIKSILEAKASGERPCAYVNKLMADKLSELDEKIRELMEFRRALVGITEKWKSLDPLWDVGDEASVCPLIESAGE